MFIMVSLVMLYFTGAFILICFLPTKRDNVSMIDNKRELLSTGIRDNITKMENEISRKIDDVHKIVEYHVTLFSNGQYKTAEKKLKKKKGDI